MTRTATPFTTASPAAAIWILEADPKLGKELVNQCRQVGWGVSWFTTPSAFEIALSEENPELLLLNQTLSEKSGFTEIQELRQGGHRFAILMLSSGPSTPSERLRALELGADDVLSAPFLSRELLLRIEHLLSRNQGQNLTRVPIGHGYQLAEVHFDPDNRLLLGPQGQTQPLSRGEVVLLLALCRAPGAVLNRAFLARTSGSLVDAEHSRSLDVRISKLRRLLTNAGGNDGFIACVRGQGYRLNVPVEPAAWDWRTTVKP